MTPPLKNPGYAPAEAPSVRKISYSIKRQNHISRLAGVRAGSSILVEMDLSRDECSVVLAILWLCLGIISTEPGAVKLKLGLDLTFESFLGFPMSPLLMVSVKIKLMSCLLYFIL